MLEPMWTIWRIIRLPFVLILLGLVWIKRRYTKKPSDNEKEK